MINWHADGEGRCHEKCEAFVSSDRNRTACEIVNVLPWHSLVRNINPGVPCPFAVFADVLRLHERTP